MNAQAEGVFSGSEVFEGNGGKQGFGTHGCYGQEKHGDIQAYGICLVQHDDDEIKECFCHHDQHIAPHDCFCISAGFFYGKVNDIYKMKDDVQNRQDKVYGTLADEVPGHAEQFENGVGKGNGDGKYDSTDNKADKKEGADLAAGLFHVSAAIASADEDGAADGKSCADCVKHVANLVYKGNGADNSCAHVCGDNHIYELENLVQAAVKNEGQGYEKDGFYLGAVKNHVPADCFFFV